MKKSSRILIYGAAGIAGLISAAWLLGRALRPDERVSGPPTTKRLGYRILKPGEEASGVRFGTALALVDGQPVGMTQPLDRNRAFAQEVQAVWKLRQTTLPKDADRVNSDAYSKEMYWLPLWVRSDPAKLTPGVLVSAGNGSPVDEFGRAVPGNYGDADNSLWGQTFGGLLRNPLFRTVAIAALVASGPQGAAIYGAYTMWENRGKSVKDIAVATGRSYAQSQCGPACGAAYDFGVGAASGKSYDRAAEDAMLGQLSSEQQAQYRLGKQSVGKLRT